MKRAIKSVVRRLLGTRYAAIADVLTSSRIEALERQVAALEQRVRVDLAGSVAALEHPDLVGNRSPDLASHELRIHSQNGEDGILLHLLSIAGAAHRRLVEIGIGDGSECNSAHLLQRCGWAGTLIEGNPEGAASAAAMYRHRDDVQVVNAFVTAENVNDLLPSDPIDLLSIDVDGNDYWVWKAIEADPAVVVVEYNASLGPERSLTIPYDPGFDYTKASDHRLYHGASLAALTHLALERGMALVGCDSQGVNAFFVRTEHTGPDLPALTPSAAWRPIQKRLLRWDQATQQRMLGDFDFVEIPRPAL